MARRQYSREFKISAVKSPILICDCLRHLRLNT